MAEEVSQSAGVEEVKTGDGEQVVTPWVAHAGTGDKGIDYEKLISEFQCMIASSVHSVLGCVVIS